MYGAHLRRHEHGRWFYWPRCVCRSRTVRTGQPDSPAIRECNSNLASVRNILPVSRPVAGNASTAAECPICAFITLLIMMTGLSRSGARRYCLGVKSAAHGRRDGCAPTRAHFHCLNSRPASIRRWITAVAEDLLETAEANIPLVSAACSKFFGAGGA